MTLIYNRPISNEGVAVSIVGSSIHLPNAMLCSPPLPGVGCALSTAQKDELVLEGNDVELVSNSGEASSDPGCKVY